MSRRQLTNSEKKQRWVKMEIRKNPRKSIAKLNKEVRERYGSGFNTQALSDLKHIVLHTEAQTPKARERVFEKRISKTYKPSNLKIPKDLTNAPRATTGFKKHNYATPINKMRRPDLLHGYYADVEFPVPVDVKGRKYDVKKTRFATVFLGNMSRDDLIRQFRTGQADRVISQTVLKDYGVPDEHIDFSVLGFWATKQTYN